MESDYMEKFMEINKNYRHEMSKEILVEKNYVVITSILPVADKEDNKDFEYQRKFGYANEIHNYKILKSHTLSAKESRDILSQFSNGLKSRLVDIAMGDVAAYKISVYNKHHVLLIETELNCFHLMNISYPLARYVDRLSSKQLFLEAQKHIPLTKEQLEFIAEWLPKKEVDILLEQIKNFK